MRSFVLALIFTLGLICSCDTSTDSPVKEEIFISDIPDTLHSNIINDDFKIYVNTPRGYEHGREKGYDVIYILDGDWYFMNWMEYGDTTFGVVSMAGHLAMYEVIPSCISIGIGYVHENMRFRDFYTPPDTMYLEYGHAREFYLFLRDELIPLVDNRLNTKKERGRILIGSSAGGYFSLYAYLKYDHNSGVVFNNIISCTPRVNHWEYYILNHARECYERNGNNLPMRMYLTFGTGYAELSSEQLATFYNTFNAYNFPVRKVIYEGENHLSVYYPSVIDGLTWFFNE